MKKIITLLSLGCAFWLVNAYASLASPAGYWLQISDTNQQPQSILYLWDDHGVVSGKVVTGFLVDGQPPQQNCSECPQPFKDKPIMGMTILWGFKAQDGVWEGGHILDPNRGSIYHCVLTLENKGTQLKVRGYIGFPLFGRTQVWNRLTPEQAQEISQHSFQTVLTAS